VLFRSPNDLFHWRGIDGSEVMTYFIDTPTETQAFDKPFSTYNAFITPHSVLGSWAKFKDKELSREFLISYGYGDGGGGVTREMLKMRRAMDLVPGLPNVKTSRAGDFFRKMHENIDSTKKYVHTWDGELYFEMHRGTYTTQAYNKKMNRQLEFRLAFDEWLSSLRYVQGGAYPHKALYEGWETVLRNQFHDIIPGSSIREVYQDSRVEYSGVVNTLTTLEAEVMSELASEDENTYTAASFSSFGRCDLLPLPTKQEGVFLDGEGSILPSQKTEGGCEVLIGMEPLSLETIRFVPGENKASASPFLFDGRACTLETPHYSLTWDSENRLTRIYDRDNGREVLPEGAFGNVLEVYEDRPANHEAWDINLYYTQKREEAHAAKPAVLIESGPLKAVVRFYSTYNKSEFIQDMIVYQHSRRIDFKTIAQWQEDKRLLKAAFTVDIRSTQASYDIQFGYVQRPTHYNTSWDYARFEVVGHKWADLSETGYGVGLLNDCKYGYGIHDNKMTISLLRSSKTPDTHADMGSHSFTYSLLPHSGGLLEGGVIEESTALNLPLFVVPGKTDIAGRRLFKTSCKGVDFDAIKKAEHEDCVVLRLHECRGGTHQVEISSDYTIERAEETNLLEEGIAQCACTGKIQFQLKPFEIKTFKVWFARA